MSVNRINQKLLYGGQCFRITHHLYGFDYEFFYFAHHEFCRGWCPFAVTETKEENLMLQNIETILVIQQSYLILNGVVCVVFRIVCRCGFLIVDRFTASLVQCHFQWQP